MQKLTTNKNNLIEQQYKLVKQQSFPKHKISKKEILCYLFFPLYPVKALTNISLLVMLAALIALGLVLSLIHINIPGVGISIGFSNLASLLIGWFFGPVYGLFMGMTIDTIAYLMQGGVWF